MIIIFFSCADVDCVCDRSTSSCLLCAVQEQKESRKAWDYQVHTVAVSRSQTRTVLLELINTLRKCTLLGLQVFVPDSYTTMKALVGVLVLFLCALIKVRLSLFKISVISRLGKDRICYTIEHREMQESLLKLYGGLIFIQPD